MLAKTILPVIALGASFAVAQDAKICSQDKVSINSDADAAKLADCDTVEGTVTIGSAATGQISIEGPTEIEGDLIIEDNGGLDSFSSSTLETIGGAYKMHNVTALNTVNLAELTKVGSLDWQSLSQLESLSFASGGLKSASTIRISDTFLSTLNAISVISVQSMDINNNNRLISWESGLQDLSDNMAITANGLNLEVSFPNLVWIANLTIANVSSFSVPSLKVVNGSMRFDTNFFTEFEAPNMTETSSGDVSFIGNTKLANISFPILTKVSGGLLIANNTLLETLDGFPELETVGGAVKLRGNFTTVELPSLNDVKGAFDITSTDDIADSCGTFDDLAPSSQGGNGKIQGSYTCSGNFADANDVNSDGTSDGTGDADSAAVSPSSSFLAMVTIAALSGFAALIL